MKLEQSFTVEAPIQEVWDALVDVERIAPCLPGAQITGRDEETGAYKGTFSVKLGPTTAAYNGSLRMEKADEASRTATMSAKGTDKRGQGGASATIVSVLREQDGATLVQVDTDFTITGRLARFGRGGMIEDISKRLLRDFSSCLAATLQGPSASAAPGSPTPPPPDSASAPAHPGAAAEGAGPPPTAAPAAPAAAPAPAPAKPVNASALALGLLRERAKRLWARIGRAVNERRRR